MCVCVPDSACEQNSRRTDTLIHMRFLLNGTQVAGGLVPETKAPIGELVPCAVVYVGAFVKEFT